METLFDNAKKVLEDLNSLQEDPETVQDAVQINPQIRPELEKLSQIAKAELNCQFRFLSLSPFRFDQR